MLPKRRRLTRQLFPTNTRSSLVAHTEHFSLRTLPTTSGGARVSVVVSKKVAPRAVDRHTVKRRVYTVAHKETYAPGAYVFFAKAGAHTISFREVHDEILSLFSEARRSIEKRARVV
jgi:ribonuclease P protein component